MVTKPPRVATACDDRWSAGAHWLAAVGSSPGDVLTAWANGELAEVPTPGAWLVAEAELTASMAALPVLARAGKLGPLLGGIDAGLAWWLVPPDADAHLGDLAPRVGLRGLGWVLRCPAPGDYGHGRGWLHRPDGTGRLTCPMALGALLSGRAHFSGPVPS